MSEKLEKLMYEDSLDVHRLLKGYKTYLTKYSPCLRKL